MQPLILVAIGLAAATAADDTAKAPAPIPVASYADGKCQDLQPRMARPMQPAAPRKLGEEPPARGLYAVLNSVEGCIKPIYVDEWRAK